MAALQTGNLGIGGRGAGSGGNGGTIGNPGDVPPARLARGAPAGARECVFALEIRLPDGSVRAIADAGGSFLTASVGGGCRPEILEKTLPSGKSKGASEPPGGNARVAQVPVPPGATIAAPSAAKVGARANGAIETGLTVLSPVRKVGRAGTLATAPPTGTLCPFVTTLTAKDEPGWTLEFCCAAAGGADKFPNPAEFCCAAAVGADKLPNPAEAEGLPVLSELLAIGGTSGSKSVAIGLWALAVAGVTGCAMAVCTEMAAWALPGLSTSVIAVWTGVAGWVWPECGRPRRAGFWS